MDDVITVAVVDDHPAMRLGVRLWMESADPPIRVTAEGDSIMTAWTEPGDRADVVVLDLELRPGVPGYDDLKRLATAGRRVVVYTHRQDQAAALACIAGGATTYLTKHESNEHLVSAVRAAAAGEQYVSPSLAGAMANNPAPDRPRLSPREKEVLLAWFRSSSKQMVATRLYLSLSAVNRHIERARAKYAEAGRAAGTKADLLKRAVEDELVTWEDL
ncbi:response regulator transcription factor [Actinophytocola sp.]|uniref:response regulator transcription factor n=1 Tax=Actinophytocola sp. TaxID=1872138 RepID=UPI002D7606EB|nr:response regulator transcription factor [Actinophytocola sp.]HYQ65947.1 response regulator transcription factor [Actinophytocola sp.]